MDSKKVRDKYDFDILYDKTRMIVSSYDRKENQNVKCDKNELSYATRPSNCYS